MGSWGAGDGIVEFPNGLRARGRGLRRQTEPVNVPEFGVYLTGREPRFLTGHDPGITTWPYRWVRWRDFRLPDSTPAAVRHSVRPTSAPVRSALRSRAAEGSAAPEQHSQSSQS